MPSTRVVRLRRLALVCNVVVVVSLILLVALVFGLGYPHSLLVLALPLSLLAQRVQLSAFKAENAELVCPSCSGKLAVRKLQVRRGNRPRRPHYLCSSCGSRFYAEHGALVADPS